jgi:hypothetical protein
MYLIKNILVDGERYVSSKIAGHTHSKNFSAARDLMVAIALEMVTEEFGRIAGNNAKIIDIHSMDQIVEPPLDGMLLYRLAEKPEVIMIYQKRTTSVEQTGYLWSSKATLTEFKKTNVLEIEETTIVTSNIKMHSEIKLPTIEMVSAGPSGRIQIPKPMQQSPMCDLIEELKKSVRFQSLHRE